MPHRKMESSRNVATDTVRQWFGAPKIIAVKSLCLDFCGFLIPFVNLGLAIKIDVTKYMVSFGRQRDGHEIW